MTKIIIKPMEIAPDFSSNDSKILEQTERSNKVVTLGSLYIKDLPDGFFLPQYPSSFNPKAKFLNDEKYVLHDIPAYSIFNIEYLKPMQLCLIVGNDLPILVKSKPGEKLKQHWKRWLPFLPDADTRDFIIESTGESKLITQYPLQALPIEKHAIDPDIHHKLLSKSTIPEMGANCPRHMSLLDYSVPCILKVTHGASGKGVYLAKTKSEAETIISQMQSEMRCPEPCISEVIEDITGNYCVQFYLYKTGDVEWLGCTTQVLDEDFKWHGGIVDWNKQDELKLKLYETVKPVKEYLHKNGYFGVVGIDVLSNKNGDFVVDVNARINGTTPLLLIAPYFAQMGYPISELLMIPVIKCSEAKMMEMFDKINSTGKGVVINLASVEADDGQSCEGHVCMFGKTKEGIQNIYDIITTPTCRNVVIENRTFEFSKKE
ncbi:hypothetical protein AC249_AIPGENE3036 [Exaiptasia diaphana]|nr:hypothetical protein AC249_AIPGENE3036 [Exaiptasia diaphana]